MYFQINKYSNSCDLSAKPAPNGPRSICKTSKKNFLGSKIDNLNPFYSEFYADSEFATFSMFTSIFWEIYAVKVWTKSQKCHFSGKIHHGNCLFWSQSVGSGQDYPGQVRGLYVRVCVCRCLYVSVPLVVPTPGRSVLIRAGTRPVILYIVKCLMVPIGAGSQQVL